MLGPNQGHWGGPKFGPGGVASTARQLQMELVMRNGPTALLCVALIMSFVSQAGLAKDLCDAQSIKGEICLCKLTDLHPTQTSVGLAEVRIKAEKLKDEIQRRSQREF